MRKLFYLISTITILSCNNSETKEKTTLDTTTTSTDKNAPQDDELNGCYLAILKRDTLVIKLNQTKNAVTGKMMFDNYEKDGSTGTVHGTIEGNIVKLWYNFASEGMNSVMEIYLKKEGTRLLRGMGPVDAKGDTSYFTNHSAIEYPQDQSYNKVPCEELPGKFK